MILESHHNFICNTYEFVKNIIEIIGGSVMKIEQIDKNFIVNTNFTEPDIIWYNVREIPFELNGVFYDETQGRFLRIPQSVAENISKEVVILNTHTSGGRVSFKTNSSYIAINAMMDPAVFMPHMPLTGQAGFDIYRKIEGKETYFKTFVPPTNWENGYTLGTKTLSDFTDYTINFPLYHGVKELYIGLKKNAILEAPITYKNNVPVVFYGNSITQGGCASRPGNSYQGFLSRRLSMNFINLGFSGSGKGESVMAEYIADIDMSVLVMDYDSNAPTAEHLKLTYYPFYKTVRDKNPNLPIILISHPSALHGVCYKTMTNYEDWGTFKKRKEVIKSTYNQALADGDKNIYFIDGSEIFKGEEWDAVTVDGTHPNDFGFLRFAQYLERYLKPLLK